MTEKEIQVLVKKRAQEGSFNMQICSHIAQLFHYPDRNYRDMIDLLHNELLEYGHEATDEFLPVREHFINKKISELQEYYINTFDVNATCYLDIGYVLFGEESKRGQFLLNMKSEQLKAANDCGTEFPDHLPNVLTLLPKIVDNQFKEELVVIMLLPALKHMLENFTTEQNIYRNLIVILILVLETTFNDSLLEPYRINQREIESSGIYSCGMDFTKMNNKKH